MQKPQIPIFMEITDAEWDEMVRLLCLREKKFKKNKRERRESEKEAVKYIVR